MLSGFELYPRWVPLLIATNIFSSNASAHVHIEIHSFTGSLFLRVVGKSTKFEEVRFRKNFMPYNND